MQASSEAQISEQAALAEARRLAKFHAAYGCQSYLPYPYNDRQGKTVFWRVRLNYKNGCSRTVPLSFSNDKWHSCVPHGTLPLYETYWLWDAEMRKDAQAFVVQSEATAEALWRRDIVATVAADIDRTDWTPLRGYSVLVWPDTGLTGHYWGLAIVEALKGITQAHVVDVNESPDAWLARQTDPAASLPGAGQWASSKRRQASQWLLSCLVEGPVAVQQIQQDGAALGFSARTLRRARHDVGAVIERAGFGGEYFWRQA